MVVVVVGSLRDRFRLAFLETCWFSVGWLALVVDIANTKYRIPARSVCIRVGISPVSMWFDVSGGEVEDQRQEFGCEIFC